MSTATIQSGWQSDESGYDITSSPEIIQQTLTMLKSKRMFLILLHKGYQSGSTVLVNRTDRHLLIDKPVDWPGKETVIRVVFRDPAKLWNHFTVKVVGVKEDLLYTTLPLKLFRLQRRAHFRVETPRDSRVSFLHKGIPCAELEVFDISAGGMQACSPHRLPLTGERDPITNITIDLPASMDVGDTTLSIRKGEVVRIAHNEEKNYYCYGITFSYTQNEEELLLRYVRQRELELLRSGLSI